MKIDETYFQLILPRLIEEKEAYIDYTNGGYELHISDDQNEVDIYIFGYNVITWDDAGNGYPDIEARFKDINDLHIKVCPFYNNKAQDIQISFKGLIKFVEEQLTHINFYDIVED